MPGIDDAWPTRLPPGWQTFPDGSIGPPNAPSPIDSAWPTRLPGSSYGPPPGTSLSGPGGGPASAAGGAPPYTDGLSVRPQVANPYGAGMPRGTGPDIMSPSNQPLRPGMSPTVRNGPGAYTDADILGEAGNAARGIVSKALPWAGRVLGPLGAYFGSTTPAETGEAPTNLPQQRPSYAGPTPAPAPAPIEPYGPTRVNAPIEPYGPTRTAGPPIGSPAPAVPPPRPRPVPAVVAQRPNLGNYTTIPQPNIARTGNVRGGIAAAPDMGVVDLSRLFQRPQQ